MMTAATMTMPPIVGIPRLRQGYHSVVVEPPVDENKPWCFASDVGVRVVGIGKRAPGAVDGPAQRLGYNENVLQISQSKSRSKTREQGQLMLVVLVYNSIAVFIIIRVCFRIIPPPTAGCMHGFAYEEEGARHIASSTQP